MSKISSEYFFEDRIYIQKMSKSNREQLFVEVNQKDLKNDIFEPLDKLINNQIEYENHFFGKRFAILGDIKIGKTELGKCINIKLSRHYENCIVLTINSKMAQYLSIKEIDEWLYSQWLTHLTQVDNQKFKKLILDEINKFQNERGYHPLNTNIGNYLDKVYLICKVYKEYLKLEPGTKYVVEFDQANVITEESQFIPFYEFWRNFQGFWEDDKYFSELPIFIFVIGHKEWENFAALKDIMGRGVFDKWIIYNYWNTGDIYQLFRKRLEYAIKSQYHEKLLKYFLCPGIVDLFGKRIGEASTQEYLDAFFGEFLTNFLKNFEYNKQKFKDFLDFCTKDIRRKKYEETYFDDIERIFSGTPALDYMPVFRFLRENENEKWFNEIFTMIERIYEKDFIPFNSKGLKDYESLTHRFIYENFSLSVLSSMKPIHNPPLFHDYEGKLALDSAFKRCLDAIPSDKRGPIYRLKRFVKSERIEHEIFDEEKDGKEMREKVNSSLKISNEILSIIQEWYVNEYFGIIDNKNILNSNNLIPFDIIRKKIVKLNDLYKGDITNWALFDKTAREIPDNLLGKYFPKTSIFISFLNLNELKNINDEIISPKTSNINMIRLINKLLSTYLAQIKDFGNTIKKKGTKRDLIKEIILKGENLTTEFKSSLRYDYNQKKPNIELELQVAKTVVAFLNTLGGKLFIGINDDGQILGLDNDFLTLKKKNRDGFKLRLIDIINNHLGREYNHPEYIRVSFRKKENKDICIVRVRKSKEPVFLKKSKDIEVFVIRTEASTIELNVREAHKYIKTHWK